MTVYISAIIFFITSDIEWLMVHSLYTPCPKISDTPSFKHA